MLDRDPRRLAAWAVAALALLALSAWYLTHSRTTRGRRAAARRRRSPSQGETEAAAARSRSTSRARSRSRASTCLASGARVEDALERAGGPTRKADLSQINRAAKLEDGRQVLVPARAEPVRGRRGARRGGGGADAARPAAEPQHRDARATRHARRRRPATAQKILDYRDEHGGFGRVDELDQIPGIGEKRLAALRERVRI